MMKHIFSIQALLIMVLALPGITRAQDIELDTDDKRFSYALGARLGQQLAEQFKAEEGIDFAILLAGLAASAEGTRGLLSEEQIVQAISDRRQKQLAAAARVAEEKALANAAFLNEHKGQDGVLVADSGLQYRVLNSGDPAGESPAATDTVVVHYQGTLLDGTVFDSSYERGEPATFSLQSIIPGWTEALQLMKPGDKYAIVLPPELAYGERGAGQLIGPGEVLLFDIELIEVRKSAN